MSANNVVWVMKYGRLYHVFYSGCFDNTPTEPDYKDKYYDRFDYRKDALEYGHDIVNKIYVEYGVLETF